MNSDTIEAIAEAAFWLHRFCDTNKEQAVVKWGDSFTEVVLRRSRIKVSDRDHRLIVTRVAEKLSEAK